MLFSDRGHCKGGSVTRSARGRRPLGSGAREAILEAARREFGELGYRRATLRGIAAAAGVDPRLVLHYFGSKKQLFMQTVELPVDPEVVMDRIFESGFADVGARAADVFVSILDDPAARRAFTGIIRAAVSEPEAADIIREVLTQRLLTPFAQRVGGDRPELRASLMSAQLVGLVMARHIVRIDPLAGASHDQLVRALAPVFDHLLTGDWVDAGEGGST
jgi:AcrR family transcriptional regulator